MSPQLMLLFVLSVFTPKVEASPIPDYNGTGITRWGITPNSPNVTFFIDPSAASLATLIQTAFNDWASIPTVYITFTPVSSASQANITIKLQPSVGLAGASGVAHTQTDSDGTLTSCAIEISSQYTPNKGTIQHETGHCLG